MTHTSISIVNMQDYFKKFQTDFYLMTSLLLPLYLCVLTPGLFDLVHRDKNNSIVEILLSIVANNIYLKSYHIVDCYYSEFGLIYNANGCFFIYLF